MLYELIATVRPRTIAEVKDIAKTAGKLVLSNGGVIRGFTNWGVFALPKPLPNRSGQSNTPQSTPTSPSTSSSSQRAPKHTTGHYFIMRFDSSARAQHLLRKTWNSDPRLLRFSVVKMGDKLEDICDVGGRAEEWAGVEGAEGSAYMGGDDGGRMERGAVNDVLRDNRGSGGIGTEPGRRFAYAR
ncbi:hypothetical protein EJ08DRAFT_736671 [Tothia fuscella]|uniref:Ribosomal protein S6 n=1 Tax=Tothia fuscella TaxID=1048955 RepID=A0A9P4NKW8_9PEZI|nr:hypothetical protein EJ08DRAFT_736671 [Tothia fuscella]